MSVDHETDIPPIRHPMGFLSQVALMVRKDNKLERDSEDRPLPERTEDGRLVYALPGGGRWVPAAFLTKQAS